MKKNTLKSLSLFLFLSILKTNGQVQVEQGYGPQVELGYGPQVELESNSCERKLFYQDNFPSNDSSNLYGVSVSDGNAKLSIITSLSYRAHIAYDNIKDLIYTVKNNGELLESFNTNGDLISSIIIDGGIGSVTGNTFYNGSIYVADPTNKKIFKIDPETGNVDVVAENIPVRGGDLVFKNDELYLFARGIRRRTLVYKIVDNIAVFQSKKIIDKKVSGATLVTEDEFLVSIGGSSRFRKLDENGNKIGFYDITLNGDLFKLSSAGDLAGGCYEKPVTEDEFCSNYKTYLADNSKNKNGSGSLYNVEFSDAIANLTLINEFDFIFHIALDTDNNEIIIVKNDGSEFLRVNPENGDIIKSTQITPSLKATPAAVYYNNELFVGSQEYNKIVKINEDGSFTDVVNNIPVTGGDLVVREGNLYLASRTGNGLYAINVDNNSFEKVISIPSKTSGVALTDNDNLLFSRSDFSVFKELDFEGNTVANYTAHLNGAKFTLRNGDLTGGCFAVVEDTCTVMLTNGGFEEGNNFTGTWDYVSQENVLGWSTTSETAIIEIQENGGTFQKIDSNSGNYHAELNSDGLSDIYQGFCTTPGENVLVSFFHKKRKETGHDVLELYIGNDIDNIEDNDPIEFEAVSVDSWKENKYVFTVPEGQTYTYVYFKAISGTGQTVGNLLDDISVEETTMSSGKVYSDYEDGSQAVPEVLLYPSDVTNYLNIELKNIDDDYVSYEILSLTGDSLLQGAFEAFQTELTINVSGLGKGIYVVNIKSESGLVESNRFIKSSN